MPHVIEILYVGNGNIVTSLTNLPLDLSFVDIKDSLHEEEKKIKERNGYNFREKSYFTTVDLIYEKLFSQPV